MLLLSQLAAAGAFIYLGYFIGVYVERGRTPDHIKSTMTNQKQHKNK